MQREHWAIFFNNAANKGHLINLLLKGPIPKEFQALRGAKGFLFSKLALAQYIAEEDRHGSKILTVDTQQPLKSMSSGEQKKALLQHILSSKTDFIVLDNPFDNLDSEAQEALKKQLEHMRKHILIVQLVSRKSDLLPFIERFARLDGTTLTYIEQIGGRSNSLNTDNFKGEIPQAIHPIKYDGKILIALKNVSVSYRDKPVLRDIDWTISKGDFWELCGKNGTGKTTIVSMITGENPKGYGQELYIFGRKKGTGESVWDIKKNIGYFTPAMTDSFTGYHSVENMMVSGLNDSIGLYVKPTEIQLRTAKQWLQLIDLWQNRNHKFHTLSMGQKSILMCARAMIKHPPLLILDEPTAGLDDASAALFVGLVNKFTKASDTALIFVSHRQEPGLKPKSIYRLEATDTGSLGKDVTDMV